MSDLLAGIAVGDIGLSGLVVLFVVLIMVGKLVPKSTLDDAREDSKTWQAVTLAEQQINVKNTLALQELLSLAHTTNHALTEIQVAGRQVAAREAERG